MKIFQTSWKDITLEEYIEITKIQENNKGLLNRSLEVLCYLSDSDEWENEDSREVIKVYLNNNWLSKAPLTTYIPDSIGEYRLKPLGSLSLAEWIDLDSSINNNKLINIPTILYRKFKIDEWGNVIYEPYSFSLKERSIEFETVSIIDIIGIINESFKYRTDLLESFKSLFEEYEEELDEEEKGMLSSNEIKEINDEINKDNYKRQYAWQALLDEFSNGDWSSIPDILELPHTFIFNMRMAKKVMSD